MQIGLLDYQKHVKNYDINIHFSTNMTPKQASKKSNEREVYNSIRDKCEYNPKFEMGELVRTSNLDETVHKGDTTNWSYALYTTTKK